MVFHGRPSRDCAPCRKRKTRCDLDPTGCSQCRRAKIACHGYRSSNELMFRDETRTTVQKVLARQRASRLPSAPQWSPVVSARQALLSIYIGSYSNSFDTLPSFLGFSGAHHLQVSVDAVSLAFMAFQLNRQDLVPLANQSYLAALRSLGMAVRSSMLATGNAANQSLDDVTLQCVLLLDLYEKMAYQHYQSSESPGLLLSHVQGALSLVRSRPRDEFSNEMIQKLSTTSLHAFVVSCGAANIPIPKALVGLYRDLSGSICSSRWSLIDLLIRVINLRADIRGGKSSPSNLLKRARDLYNVFSDIEGKIPHFLWPRRKDTCETLAFNGYYDVYPNHKEIQLFNFSRCTRVDMAEIIQKFEPSAEVAENIAQATQAICASVPGLILPAARPHNTLPLSPLQILECSAVLPSLVSAARCTQDPAMHGWVLQTLTYMANHGVRLAHSVAHIIIFEPHLCHWDIFQIIGNYAALAT